MVELVRAGRRPDEWANEFEPTANSIRDWVQQADRDEGRREDGLNTSNREVLPRLGCELKLVKIEREILARAAVWFARETGSVPSEGSSL